MTRDPSSEDTSRTRLDALVASAHDAAAAGLVVSTSGNASVRLSASAGASASASASASAGDGGRFAISAARTRLGRLRRGEIVAIETATARHLPGLAGEEPGQRPSRETPMHAAVYRARSDAGAVLHFQSPHATVSACREGALPDLNFIPELPVYVRKVARVPYLPPGSDELARAVAAAFGDPEVRVVQLSNHGQIVVGDDPAQAVERATFFELACRLCALAAGGEELRRFSPDELALLRSY